MTTYLINYSHYRDLSEEEEVALYDELQTINAPLLGPDWDVGLKCHA